MWGSRVGPDETNCFGKVAGRHVAESLFWKVPAAACTV